MFNHGFFRIIVTPNSPRPTAESWLSHEKDDFSRDRTPWLKRPLSFSGRARETLITSLKPCRIDSFLPQSDREGSVPRVVP